MVTSSFDELLLPLFNEPYNFLLNTFFLVISFSIYVYIPFTIYYFYRKKEMRKIYQYVFNMILGMVFITFLKFTVKRPRPMYEPLIFRDDPSFPSRHSFTAMFTLRFLYPYFKGLHKIVLITYLALIPFSVLYLGVHYPSDVIVGCLLGLIFPSLVSEKIILKLYFFFEKSYRTAKILIKKLYVFVIRKRE